MEEYPQSHIQNNKGGTITHDKPSSKNEGPSGDKLLAFVDNVLEMQKVPVVINFSIGPSKTFLTIGIVRTTIEDTETLRDVFEVINDSGIDEALFDTYGVKLPDHAEEVEIQLSDDDRAERCIYTNVEAHMDTKIWVEGFIERGIRPSMDLCGVGHVPRIEVNVIAPGVHVDERPVR